MENKTAKIIYTGVDEAPALATYSLLPIVNAFTKTAGITIETRDISLAARIISTFPDFLTDNQKTQDELAYLGNLVKKEDANIIKLPNISASIPQLKAAIKELQEKGYKIPDYPEEPKTEDEKNLQKRFAKVLGSAVNPVLREGNSDRRVAPSVKAYAKKNPKKLGEWSSNSKTHVANMTGDDFYSNEKSIISDTEQTIKIEFIDENNKTTILKDNLKLLKGEIFDGTFLSANSLRVFIEEQLQEAKESNMLFSVHLKATMMKVSDPVIFGHFVSVYFKDVFEKHNELFNKLGVNPNLGLGDLYVKIKSLDKSKQAEIEADIQEVYKKRPALAMVNSDKGITNLHAGNDIIIDASMPVVIRDSGKMWNPKGELQDTKAVIPDASYATFYQEAISFCKENGAFDPTTMGNVSNVGLMAQKAEEYGSHDKTFIIKQKGKVRVIDANNNILIEHNVNEGDIWRGCQAKDLPIKDWIKLAISRAKATSNPVVFWLDKNRAHDANLIKKINTYLKDIDTDGVEIHIKSPVEAMQYTLPRVKDGKDTISATGNVLRDYLTDLFPILELGTSAKMLSIVPLLAGGGLFETGAGGSAPKHVQQFIEKGHLRWDSLGEFLALTVSLEHLSNKFNNTKAKILSETLDSAVAKYLDNGNSPSRKVGELDNRGTHFYLAMYWAESLSSQNKDTALAEKFKNVAKDLIENKDLILKQIADAEGKPTDMGGYYLPQKSKVEIAMRPSEILNTIINNI